MQFGLRATDLDAANGDNASVGCLFCQSFGKQMHSDQNRPRMLKIEMFQFQPRVNYMKVDITAQHEKKF